MTATADDLPRPTPATDASAPPLPASLTDAVAEAEAFFPRQRRTRAAMIAIGVAGVFVAGVMLARGDQRRAVGLTCAAAGVLCFALDRIMQPIAAGAPGETAA